MNIHPSPSLIAKSDTTIEECVRLMQERGVGAILIISNEVPERLVGIFTERDLLKKFNVIQKDNLWKRPVVQVMSKPVVSLDLQKIHEAAELMSQKNIRHLPIVNENGPADKLNLLGVISMRDLFKHYVQEEQKRKLKNQTLAANSRKLHVRVVSSDKSLHTVLGSGLFGGDGFQVESTTLDSIVLNPTGSDAVVLDIDGMSSDQWTAVIKRMSKSKNMPLTVLLFSPETTDTSVIDLLHKAATVKMFSAFAKPVALGELFEHIRSMQ